MENKIKFLGNTRGQNQGLVGSVYSGGGCCPALRSRDYKDPLMVLVKNGNNNIRYSITSKDKETQS